MPYLYLQNSERTPFETHFYDITKIKIKQIASEIHVLFSIFFQNVFPQFYEFK